MSGSVDSLTQREFQVLVLVGEGKRTKTIARHFNLSHHTIYKDIERAMRKLGAPDREAAAAMIHSGPSYEGFVYEPGELVSPPPAEPTIAPEDDAQQPLVLREASAMELPDPLVRRRPWWTIRPSDLTATHRVALMLAIAVLIPMAAGALLLGTRILWGLIRAISQTTT